MKKKNSRGSRKGVKRRRGGAQSAVKSKGCWEESVQAVYVVCLP